jgi:hypothetical protein
MTRAKDISKIVTDADFSGTLNVSGAFTSQGIDDNADATAITINSSEQVGIGTSPATILHIKEASPIFTQETTGNVTTSGVAYQQVKDVSGSSVFTQGFAGLANCYQFGTSISNGFMRFLTGSAVEAMRIDSSGNLLVGTTDMSPYDNTSGAGISLRSSGAIYNAMDGGTPLVLNRMTNDGDIIQLRQGGSKVGLLKSRSGVVSTFIMDQRTTGNGGVGITGTGNTNTPAILPTDENGTVVDNNANIGDPSQRFKDLYLSGGVYLGGTGSANKLEDYEEGTWAPTLIGSTSGEASYNARDGHYIKVGEMVTIFFHMTCSSVTALSGNVEVGNLPFNVNNALTGTGVQAGCAVGFFTGLSSTISFMSATPQGNTSKVPIRVIGGTGTTAITTLTPSYLSQNFGFRFTCSYIAS